MFPGQYRLIDRWLREEWQMTLQSTIAFERAVIQHMLDCRLLCGADLDLTILHSQLCVWVLLSTVLCPLDMSSLRDNWKLEAENLKLKTWRLIVIFLLVWDFYWWPFSLFLGPFLGAKKSPFLTPFAQRNQWENYQKLRWLFWKNKNKVKAAECSSRHLFLSNYNALSTHLAVEATQQALESFYQPLANLLSSQTVLKAEQLLDTPIRVCSDKHQVTPLNAAQRFDHTAFDILAECLLNQRIIGGCRAFP